MINANSNNAIFAYLASDVSIETLSFVYKKSIKDDFTIVK